MGTHMQKMYYTKASGSWDNGLPIGNGRLAGMVWETENTDVITVNHEKLWSGVKRHRECIEGAEYLPLVRKLLLEDKPFEATAAANLFLGGKGGTSGLPHDIDPYQPAGVLKFIHREENPVKERSLALETGVAESRREGSNACFFADCVEKVIFLRWSGSLNGDLIWERDEDKGAAYAWTVEDNRIVFHCDIEGGIEFTASVIFATDGCFTAIENGVRIENAGYLNVIVDVEIPMFPEDDRTALPENFGEYFTAHCSRFASFMNRSSLVLECDESLSRLPTDERVLRLREGGRDNGLLQLYFDYGRYLLLSSNISGTSPANLQGKWNNLLCPPWESDYHMNINLQMNYWMAEPLGMHECTKNLFAYMTELLPSGKEAAMKVYGCRGVLFPLTGDIWPNVTSDGYGWSVWIGAAPWMSQHMWQHYLYTGDKDFLRDTAYPFFYAVAEFYEDYLVKDENGVYQIMPSQSPENWFVGTGQFPVSICISSAMDIELATDALGYAVRSAEILGVDGEKIGLWNSLLENLEPLKIGSDGRLLEWDKESRVEFEPGHRHVSHLYAMYPSDLINEYDTPELYRAGRKSLDVRLSSGGGHTGWSRAWSSCLYGKLGEKDLFLEHYEKLITDFATDSLLDVNPYVEPERIFQIDGNLGAVAAVLEALVSVSGGRVRLLRALPDVWANGKLNGVYLPGGHRISFSWKDSRVERLEVEFGFGEEIRFALNGAEFTAKKSDGKTVFEF